MLAIFLKTLPFFALIGVGFLAAYRGFFTQSATAYLTKFVFYFALSAMLFRFASTLSLGDIFDWNFIGAYLFGCFAIYALATAVALIRKRPSSEAAIEAQCAVIGNTGFLGVPMLVVLMGPAAAGPVLMILATDLIVFSSLIVIIITASRDGRMRLRIFRSIAIGLVKNPMIVSMVAGLSVAAVGLNLPAPVDEFMALLGAAATPCALFAIGASLAGKSTERASVALWLSFAKLILHPAAVAIGALIIFEVDPYSAAVMIAASSLPVAGNIYMLAQHYNVASQRVSASILMSTAISIISVSLVIGWLSQMVGFSLP